MSIYGKFLPEFDRGNWSFVWEMAEVEVTTGTSTIRSLSASFTTGDASGDMLTMCGTLESRVQSVLQAYISTSYYFRNSYCDIELFPEDLTFSTSWFAAGGGSYYSTVSVTHSTLALGIFGAGHDVGGPTAQFKLYRIDYTSSDDTLLSILGFDQTETVDSSKFTISSKNNTRYSWFPGKVTYPGTGGAGITSDTGWVPVDAHSRVVSGGGNMRITGPSRLQYTRRIRFEALKRAEVLESRHNGPIAFFDQWATKAFRWYPDRDVGIVNSTGTQGDPGPSSYHIDDDCSYWLCTLANEPRITQGSDPDWFSVAIELNGEPA